MIIKPVRDLAEKIERFDRRNRLFPSPLSPQLFLAHLKGLKQFAGKKVLEIGGSHHYNMDDFFLELGTDYTNIKLEKEDSDPDYIVQENFMDHPLEKYDLIISSGVFEVGALDKVAGTLLRRNDLHPNQQYLRRLHFLTNPGGMNIHATSTDTCLFTDDEIEEAGFELQYRRGPFFSPRKQGPSYFIGNSELLVMRKRE